MGAFGRLNSLEVNAKKMLHLRATRL